MKFKKIQTGENVYEIAFDDNCLVVKSGKEKVWISKSMAKWIALNFVRETNVEIVIL